MTCPARRRSPIEQQLDRLRAAVAGHGWKLDEQHVYRDDGYSGASLGRPGLDRLRDHAALAELDLVVITATDRLARNYVHQVLLPGENRASSTAARTGSPSSTSSATISPARARPRSWLLQRAWENLCARSCRHVRDSPAPVSMPQTVRLPVWARNPAARAVNVRNDGAVNRGLEAGQQHHQRGGKRLRRVREHGRSPSVR